MTPGLYTRTGDDGMTYCYFLKKRIPKDHPVMEFIGTLDEANSSIGHAVSLLGDIPESREVAETLRKVQRLVFRIGFLPAKPESLSDKDVEWMENLIDEYYGKAPLTNFILPGGHPAASQLHIARTIMRRAERRLVKLVREGLYPDIALKAVNRLSDLLFAMALYINRLAGIKEVPL
jgi:cob(I)alamin adenosyltransferase